jgi:hypothetical protein
MLPKSACTLLLTEDIRMMTHHELAELSRGQRDEMVLSIYLAREHTDPGKLDVWKKRLTAATASERRRVEDESPDDVAIFDHALQLIMSSVASIGRVLPHSGWVAFATGDRLLRSEGLPFAPLNVVRFRKGAYVGPYLRSQDYTRPIAVALVDRWRARLFRYQHGDLHESKDLLGNPGELDVSGSGMRKGAASVSGVRGATRSDAASRALDTETERFRRQVAAEVLAMAGESGGVALGGAKGAVRALRAMLEDDLEGRFVELFYLDLEASSDELMLSVEEAASRLSAASHTQLLDACEHSAGGAGLGWNNVQRALAAGAVETLVLSEGLLESSPDATEELLILALEKGATVEAIRGEAGRRLLHDWDGVATRLRFEPTPAESQARP